MRVDEKASVVVMAEELDIVAVEQLAQLAAWIGECVADGEKRENRITVAIIFEKCIQL